MIERFFKLTLALSCLVVASGIIAAALTGSDRAFELRPVAAIARTTWSWILAGGREGKVLPPEAKPPAAPPTSSPTPSASRSVQPSPTTPPAAAASRSVQPSPSSQPLVSGDDPRLSICSQGAAETGLIEVGLTTAEEFRRQIKSKPLTSLPDAQATLGEPHCNELQGKTRKWRYLVAGGRIIDLEQQGDQPPTARFTNF